MTHTMFLLPVHSHLDLVTNSSSELFLLTTDSTVKAVKAVVTELACNLKRDPLVDPWKNGWFDHRAYAFTGDFELPTEAQKRVHALHDTLSKTFMHARAPQTKETLFLSACNYVRHVGDGHRWPDRDTVTPRVPMGFDPVRCDHTPASYAEAVIEKALNEWVLPALGPTIDYFVEWSGCTEVKDILPELIRFLDWRIYLDMDIVRTELSPPGYRESFNDSGFDKAVKAKLRGWGVPLCELDPFYGWWNHYTGFSTIVGRHITWTTAGDNTCPYEFIETLRSSLPVKTYHLG